MSMTLSEKEKRAIAAFVQEHVDEHLFRFPYARYPVEPLDEWKRMFCDPAAVPITALRQALGWQFGAWQRKDLPSAHSRTILNIVKAWPEFVQSAAFGAAQSFQFWEKRLPDWQNGFNAATFLLHLLRPDDFEIADQHRIQAMAELLKAINHQDSEQAFSRSLQDLERYSEFFRAIMPKLSFGSKNRLQFDRFLKRTATATPTRTSPRTTKPRNRTLRLSHGTTPRRNNSTFPRSNCGRTPTSCSPASFSRWIDTRSISTNSPWAK